MNVLQGKLFGMQLAIGATCLALCACDLGSSRDDDYACIETPRELAGIDAPLPDGGTVRDLMGMTLGTHAFVFQTPEGQKSGVTTFTPNSVGVKGVLEISELGAKVRYIESKRPELPKGLQLALYCPNRVEVDAPMKLTSEDGAFAEEVVTTIRREVKSAQNPEHLDPEALRQAQLSVDFADVPRKGTFAIQTPADFTPENTESHRLLFQVVWEDDKIKKSNLSASWSSKPEEEGSGVTSQFSTSMNIYDLVFDGGVTEP